MQDAKAGLAENDVRRLARDGIGVLLITYVPWLTTALLPLVGSGG